MSNLISEVQVANRQVRLVTRKIRVALGEPPSSLAETVEAEFVEVTGAMVKTSNDVGVVLGWLREAVSESEYLDELAGQASQIAVLVCWLNGLVPATGPEADIASSIFGIDPSKLVPCIARSELGCVGYAIELWSADRETLARQLSVNLLTAKVRIVETWYPRDDGHHDPAQEP